MEQKNYYKLALEGRELFKKIYKPLTQTLDIIYNNKEKNFEWMPVIQYWLNTLIFFYLENKKIYLYKDLKSKKFKIKINDYLDFYNLISKNEFKYFFSYLLENVEKKKINHFLKNIYGNEIKKNKESFKSILKKIILNFCIRSFNSSFFFVAKSSRALPLIFLIKTKFKLIWYNYIGQINYLNIKKKADIQNREKAYRIFLKLNKNKKIDFELIKIIFILMPFSYFENFEKIKTLSINEKINKPKYVFIDGIETFHEPLKLVLGYWAAAGTKIIQVQHSPEDLNLKLHSFYDFWHSFSYKFISWGWGFKNLNIIKLPSLKIFFQLENFKIKKNKYDIIFFPRSTNYSLVGFNLNNKIEKKVFNTKMKIINYFYKKKINFALKTRYNDESKIRNKFKNIKILSNKNLSIELYSQTQLSVFNHLSTGFFECLYSFQPAIIYLPNKNFFLYQSKSYKKLSYILNKYNFIYDNPRKINELLKNINRDEFKSTYKRMLKDKDFQSLFLDPRKTKEKWLKYFNKIL